MATSDSDVTAITQTAATAAKPFADTAANTAEYKSSTIPATSLSADQQKRSNIKCFSDTLTNTDGSADNPSYIDTDDELPTSTSSVLPKLAQDSAPESMSSHRMVGDPAKKMLPFDYDAVEAVPSTLSVAFRNGRRMSLPVRLEEYVPETQVIRDPVAVPHQPAATDGGSVAEDGLVRSTFSRFCDIFSSRQQDIENIPKAPLPKSVRSYYKKLDEVVEEYKEMERDPQLPLSQESIKSDTGQASFLAKLSLAVNIVLLILKAVAAAYSGSLSVISSLVDSVVDLISGTLIWITSAAIKKRLPYTYPTGRTRLEPVAVVILSAIMSIASVQLIGESIQRIAAYLGGTKPTFDFSNLTIGVVSTTMLLKAILWLVCRLSTSSSVLALAQDHRNDVLSNGVAAICGYIGYRWWPYSDPIGALLISFYIFINWCRTGSEQIKLLTGYTADPRFLNKLTWVSLQHSRHIKEIDTVRAYHFGNNFLVEVHIVLPETMNLREAHDIGEELQTKLESLDQVERAFVHIDYESEHDPALEHKIR